MFFVCGSQAEVDRGMKEEEEEEGDKVCSKKEKFKVVA